VPNPLVDRYMTERDGLVETVKMLQALSLDRKSDLSPADLETIEKAQQRCDDIDRQLKVIGNDLEMDEDTRDRLMRTGVGAVSAGPKYRTAGEIMYDCVHATFGSTNSHEDREAKDRYERHLKRAAQHMGTEAALTTPTAGGFGGLFVDPVVGPVIDIYPKGRPFLTAIGVQQAPNSLSFLRPRLTDDDFDTGASAQGLQKAELRSRKFDVSTDPLNLTTICGYLNVSQQLLSLHPSGWDIILRQLQARVTRATELGAIAELVKSTGSVTLATGATAAVTWAALVAGAANVAVATNMPPTWMAFGPLGWKNLAAIVDTTGRPVFPMLGATNAQGGMSLDGESVNLVGIRPIFTTAITTAHVWFGNDLSFEAYGYPFPVLEAVEPSVFGRQVAVAEAVAFFRPVANSATKVGP
jgi:hypothetical protein